MPWSVARKTGLPPTSTFGLDDPGRVAATSVHGLDDGVTGTGQPAIGAPIRSGSHSTAPPSAVTVSWPGLTRTRPPWTHPIDAFELRIGGTIASGSLDRRAYARPQQRRSHRA